ncbi:hypothetical protein KQ941_13965 [Paenibacillus xylanexedens]|uniref:hypothetical protein n=1 Tax=Paenibacillus xylanexedens TaxID=528191 RepID=UPI001F1EEDB7|nr:hypothetical protein [Paenibacillus xylanexedens]MCF7755554.1 hypothetical protein [Paenibacillus xylanexedens]
MMAVLGDQLVAPESGWRRYDDTHVGLKYTGTWTTPSPSNTVYYGGSIRVTSRAVDNNYVTFSFFGTKLRIISDFYSDRHSDNSITIDGVTEMYSAFRAVGSPSLQQSIVYEKTGLPLAFHTVTIATGHNRINFTLDAIDIDETGYLYGHALTSPETGWRRFDDTHDAFAYLGANWIAYTGANQGIYNNSHHYTSQGKGDTEIRFKFYGTKFRLISSIGPAFANDISVVIDGVTEKFNPRMPTTADERQKVTYEKTNLPLGIHEVNLISGTNGDWRLDIDAVDIDDNGYLVARVGQQLTTPEPEWKRYDTDNYALYLGTDWKTVTNSTGRVFEGGSVRYSNVIGNYIKFSFTGDKLRLIAEYGSAYDTNVEVSIDGVIKYIDLTTSSSSIQYQPQRIAFEQLGLTDGVHEVIVKKVSGTGNFHIDAIDINVTGRMVRLIGTQLTTPDEGWRRYDDSVCSIKYVGKFTNGVGAGAYNGYSNYTSTIGDKIVFEFEGTKLRLIGARYTNRSDLIEVYVDGKLHGTHSQLGTELAQVLLVDIVGLPKARHQIEIVNKSSGSTTTFMALDAIDIDLDGRLFHPDEVTSITELEVGKRIRCNYVVLTSGVAGEFKNIGKQTSDLISTTSVPSVLNGDFYFIVADEYNKKKILIADRPIQAAITWDALNSNGLVFGVQKDLGEKNYMFVARLLSGGYSAADKDNEWDQYIVNSTLNGNIIAGDDRVWNWSAGYSSTSTTNVISANRIRRGSTGAAAYGVITSATVSGYRPLVELETLPMFKSFVKHDGAYKRLDTGTLEWNTISATLPSEDTFINDGMDDLSVLDRKNEVFIQTMTANGSLGLGKLFKERIGLKKYFEITNLSVK